MIPGKFRRREGLDKTARCSCGAQSKLRKRRNFPHGRSSDPKTIVFYKCETCGNERMLNNKQEVKR